METTRPQQHEYLRRILAANAKGNLPKSGVTDLMIAHDNDCPVLRENPGICCCNPGIFFNVGLVRISIDKNGDVISRTLLA